MNERINQNSPNLSGQWTRVVSVDSTIPRFILWPGSIPVSSAAVYVF